MEEKQPEEVSRLKDLRELVEFLKANEVAEFDLERENLKLRLKFAGAEAPAAAASLSLEQLTRLMAPTALPATAPAAASPAAEAAPARPEVKHHVVKSPIVGTFYDAPAPGSPPFVKVGDQVEVGQILCIVEAMKLMNEIESDMAGEIVERVAATGQPVEYGQSLFQIKAR